MLQDMSYLNYKSIKLYEEVELNTMIINVYVGNKKLMKNIFSSRIHNSITHYWSVENFGICH